MAFKPDGKSDATFEITEIKPTRGVKTVFKVYYLHKSLLFSCLFFFWGGSLLYAHTYICLTADHVVWVRHNEARATKSPTITAAPPRPGRSRSHATYVTRDFPRRVHSYLRFGTKNTAQDRRGEAQSNNRGRSARLKRHVYYRTACSSPYKSVACKHSLSPPHPPAHLLTAHSRTTRRPSLR